MIVATTTVNFAYLSGVWLETYERFKAAVKCNNYTAYVVPALDAERVRGNIFPYRDGEDPAEALKAAASPCDSNEVYIDGGTTLLHFEVVKRAFPHATFKLADELFKRWRAVKREDEVVKIREAARRMRRVLDALELAQDATERQTAARIYLALYEAGLRPGPILVQFGSNTALPHQEPTEKKLRRGDAVVIDVSAAYEGYYADLTVSFFYGEPPRKYLEVYQTVEKAQAEAIKAAAPGVRAFEVDRAARSTIEAAGYGPYFIHRTGHGLGLEIHEAPDISPNSQDVLEGGMVFTVEPGIYIPHAFGVRLETDVHLGEKAEIL